MFDWLASRFLRIVARLVQSMPIGFGLALAHFVGLMAPFIDSKRSKVAYTNLKAAFPGKYTSRQIKKIVRKMYVHFAQVFAEMLYFPKMDRKYIERHCPDFPFERYLELTSGKSGIMMMTAHFGNWELSQILSGIIGRPMRVLAHEQKMTHLDQFLNELRASHGSKTISTKGMEIRDLWRALQNNETVGVLGDQGGGKAGTIVPFFGRKTTAPNGVMEIALRSNAKVVPGFDVRMKGPFHRMDITEPLELSETGNEEQDAKTNCRKFLERLETYIEKTPEQWLWLHKRWKFCYSKRILVLEDVRAGHRTQAMSIALDLKAVLTGRSSEYEVDVKPVEVRFKSNFHQMLFFLTSLVFSNQSQGNFKMLRFFLTANTTGELEKIPYADYIVSCGSRLVALNRWLKNEFLSKSVIVMKPPFPYSLFKFDLVVVPKHDRGETLKSHRVDTIISPNLVTDELLQHARLSLQDDVSLNGKSRLSVFIGGATKRYQFNPDQFEKWLLALKQTAHEQDLDLLITTSRRTEEKSSKVLREIFEKDARCKLLVIANEKNIENVTYGMLALSDTVLVTEDSISMISEALSAGKKVIVLRIGNNQLPEKHRQFQEILVEERLIHVASPDDFEVKLKLVRGLSVPAELIAKEKEKLRAAMQHLV